MPSRGIGQPEVHGSAKLSFIDDRAQDLIASDPIPEARASSLFSEKVGFALTRATASSRIAVPGETHKDDFNLYQPTSRSISSSRIRSRSPAYAQRGMAQFDGAAAEWQSGLAPDRRFGKPVALMGPALADDYHGARSSWARAGSYYSSLACWLYQGRYVIDRDVQATFYRRRPWTWNSLDVLLNDLLPRASARLSAHRRTGA